MKAKQILLSMLLLLTSLSSSAYDFGVGSLVYNIVGNWTSYVQNPTFDTNVDGWTVNVQNTHNYGWQSASYFNSETNTLVTHFAEAWISTPNTLGTGSISQTIASLPAGNYVLEADVIAVNQNDEATPVTGVQLFAGTGSTNVSTGNNKPQHFSVSFTHTGGSLSLGLRTLASCTANWIALDNVILLVEGTGTEVEVAYAEDGTGNGDYFTGSVTIPAKVLYNGVRYDVTAIGDKAFAHCSDMTSVSLPESVNRIGSQAFYGSGITSIDLSEHITYVGSEAFTGCDALATANINTHTVKAWFSGYTGLANLTLGSNVREMSPSAFAGTGITSIDIPSGISKIPNSAFKECQSLTSVNIADGVTYIDWDAFLGCYNLVSVSIPESVTGIIFGAFCACQNLSVITLPSGITDIAQWMFTNCSNLTSINIPEGVTWIRSSAFYGCTGLQSIVIPENVNLIGDMAFRGCSSMTTLTCKNPVPPTVEGPDFLTGFTGKIIVPQESLEDYKTAQYWSDHADKMIGLCTINYNVVWNGSVIKTATQKVLSGETTPAMPTELNNDYLTLTLNGTWPETVSSNTVINYTAVWTGPFQFSELSQDAIWWYNMVIRDSKYIGAGDSEPYSPKAGATITEQASDKYRWAFGGNPYAVIVYNAWGGFGKSLSLPDGAYNGSNAVLRDGEFTWVPVLWDGKLLFQVGNSTYTGYLNNYNQTRLALWPGRDNGSQFQFSLAPASKVVKGDINEDGQVTIADVTSLVNMILGK